MKEGVNKLAHIRQHIFNVFQMYFTTMQLLRHVNAVVNIQHASVKTIK